MKRLTALAVAAVLTLLLIPAVASAEEQPPLVIVFDTSDSMADEDSTGTVKLDAAQASMSELIRTQSAQVPLGLWTYPGGDSVDGCSPGDWIPDLAPTNQPDPTDVDAQIRALDADGDTPTGPALRAVADSLIADGLTGATIVLVSDGESNCGPPPCEVAQGIVNSGFDLTVAAVAFDIQDGDTEELTCIANATGGTFSNADDAAELIASLEQFQTKDLELTVTGPTFVRAGTAMTFTATLTNPTGTRVLGPASTLLPSGAVLGTSMVLEFDDHSLIPFVPAPIRTLPALHPGESITRTWLISTRSDRTGQTGWRILAGSASLGSVSQTGTVSVTHRALRRADAGPILTDRGGTVVILGDSYSSGEGGGDYQTELPGLACHRSPHTYGAVIGGDSSTIIACSGAVTDDLLGTRSREGQPYQLKALAEVLVPDMVLLTIGGNDIGFAGIVESCFLGACAADAQAHISTIEGYSPPSSTYEQVARAINTPELVEARGGALAPVIVSPYPDPFWDASRGVCNSVSTFSTAFSAGLINYATGGDDIGFTPEEIVAGKEILTALNDNVEEGVRIAFRNGQPVYYADTVVDMASGHSICEDDSYFVRLEPNSALWRDLADNWAQSKQELFHPNATGYAAWAEAIITWSREADLDAIATVPTAPQTSWTDNALQTAASTIMKGETSVKEPLQRPLSLGQLETASDTYTMTSGSNVHIQVGDLAPASTLLISVESAPITIGQITVDENGTAEGTVTLPELSSGHHDLVLRGYNQQWQAVGARVGLTIWSGLPIIILTAAAIALTALLALTALQLWRRRLLTTSPSDTPGSES